jgi:hypothetical protein
MKVVEAAYRDFLRHFLKNEKFVRMGKKIWRRLSHMASAGRHVSVNRQKNGDDDGTKTEPLHRQSRGNA